MAAFLLLASLDARWRSPVGLFPCAAEWGKDLKLNLRWNMAGQPDADVLLSHTMTVKTSISLTDAQEAYARRLVEQGRYASLSAVLQHGLEMLRAETEAKDAELAALRALLEERAKGEFVSMEESDAQIDAMLERKRKQYLGGPDL